VLKRRLCTASAAVCLVVATSSASAGPFTSDHRLQRFRELCGIDIQVFCSTAKTRDERRSCVRTYSSKFSPACQTFIAENTAAKEDGDAVGLEIGDAEQ
jgi:hypothetical protein